jgi:hypothetical protein
VRYLILILFPLIGFGQVKNVHKKVDVNVYVNGFKEFKLNNLLSNEVSIIRVGVEWDKVKHTKKEVHTYLVRNYSDSGLITKFVDSFNGGYMIVIGQFDKFEVVRYFTIHLDYLTRKIVAIEVEKIR